MEYKGSSNEKELHEILKRHMIRRLKKDVLKDLPDKVRTKIKVDIDPKIKKEIDLLKKEMESKGINVDRHIDKMIAGNGNGPGFSKGGSAGTEQTQGLFGKLFKLAGESKIKTVFEYLKELVEYPKKFVIFCHHKSVMKGLEDLLWKEQKKRKHDKNDPLFVKIDGSSSSAGREKAVKTFQTPLTEF